MTVRKANASDIGAIYELGTSDESFEVNPYVKFYEKEELQEWIENPKDNIVAVAEVDGRIAGFLYCKLMSSHWALLDNFYIIKYSSGFRVAECMFRFLLDELKRRKLVYLSTLVKIDRPSLIRLCKRYGFSVQDSYSWLDMQL